MKKNLLRYMLMITVSLGLASCQDWFLEMPDTSGTVDKEAVFGSAKNAKSALMTCYRESLIHGLPGGNGINHGTLGGISGEVARGYSWHGTYDITNMGLSATSNSDGEGGTDWFNRNWSYIRHCFTVRENIDLVPDMSDEEKEYVKAEATALVAYRYMGMFYRYGGLPIVRSTFANAEDSGLQAPRATLQEMLDYVIELCDEAYEGLPAGDWDAENTGRMTRGAVLAIKARALLFAARPLFNSATPYLSNGHDELICFGNSDTERWKDAIDASEAVLTWANANNYRLLNTGGAEGQPNANAFVDYATATSTPGNREVLLAYKADETNQWASLVSGIFKYNNYSPAWEADRYDVADCNNLLTNFLELYYKDDGTEFTNWPKIGDAAPRSAAEWLDNINHIESRAKADNMFIGFDAFNNPGHSNWSMNDWGKQLGNAAKDKSFPEVFGGGSGCAAPTKFYYNAGVRTWFEAPLFRMAEIYLNLAEAYNEYGNSAKALENLNKVHNRAGLPSITETNQATLREIIHRERAIEFYRENLRYFDVKHWKDADIANGIIGGNMRELHFKVKEDAPENLNLPEGLESYWDGVTYTSYWNPKMYLEPIPQSEINKGTLVQNPGY